MNIVDLTSLHDRYYTEDRADAPEKKKVIDEIKSSSPGNKIYVWNDINNLTNNSCALSYAERIGLLRNVVAGASASAAATTGPLVAPCSLSSSLDGQPSCRSPTIDDPFHLTITNNPVILSERRHVMDFGLEYGNFTLSGKGKVLTYKITFNIRRINQTNISVSHTFISEQLTSGISTQTGFYTDASENLYFYDEEEKGLTIGLVVKLFCLILVNNRELNPWDDTEYENNEGLYCSIFFLKECGDLFQEISACLKSRNGYHNYLTNDIPSILRYFLLMKLFGNGNGFGAWVHNSNQGVAFLLGIFSTAAAATRGPGARGGSKNTRKSIRRKSIRRKNTRRKSSRRKNSRRKNSRKNNKR